MGFRTWKIYNHNPYQRGAGQGRDGEGQGGVCLKILNLSPSHSMVQVLNLTSSPPPLPPLRGEKNPCEAKRGGAKLSSLTLPTKISNKMRGWIFVVGFLKSGEKFFQNFLGFLFLFFLFKFYLVFFSLIFIFFPPKTSYFFTKKLGVFIEIAFYFCYLIRLFHLFLNF